MSKTETTEKAETKADKIDKSKTINENTEADVKSERKEKAGVEITSEASLNSIYKFFKITLKLLIIGAIGIISMLIIKLVGHIR